MREKPSRKTYKKQEIYEINVRHVDLLPFLQNNPQVRAANIDESNGLLIFYLSSGKEKGGRASCVLSNRKMVISYTYQWERKTILQAVKGAMTEAGYNPNSIKLAKTMPPHDKLMKLHDAFEKGIFEFDTYRLLLEIAPGLKETMRKAKANSFTIVNGPCILLFGEYTYEVTKDRRLIVKPTAEAKEKFENLMKQAVFSSRARKKIEKLIRKKFKEAGIPFSEAMFKE